MTYLDYNASTPLDERVLSTMIEVYRNFPGNPDSRTHVFGETTKKLIETSRQAIANLLKVESEEIFFTSGSTEANNIAILGLREYAKETNKKHIITSSIEHKSVLEAVKHLQKEGFEIDFIDPQPCGAVKVKDITDKIRPDTLLVSILHVNNETGVIQPVMKLANALKDTDILFHIDATQSCGKLMSVQNLEYDMMSINAHKMYGPQGVGALILKKKNGHYPPVKSIMYGGSQENGIRPGTLPTALIAGFGKACELALEEHQKDFKHTEDIKTKLINILDDSNLEYKINGVLQKTVPNTLNISISGVSSEALMSLTNEYCCISAGSACNSMNRDYSYVLRSMGLTEDEMASSIRISWGRYTDIEKCSQDFIQLVKKAEMLVKYGLNN